MEEFNKYRRAMNNIALDINEGVIYSTRLTGFMNDLNTLDELVDRSMPKKVVLVNNWYKCPSCGGLLAFNVKGLCIDCQNIFCGGCGQKLDWGEDKK